MRRLPGDIRDGALPARWRIKGVAPRLPACACLVCLLRMHLCTDDLLVCMQHPAFKAISNLAKESRPDPLPIVSLL